MRSGPRPTTMPSNKGGFVVIVAIADVAFYVRPGTALDSEALKRGNSVYFPDQVVPMLPEALSTDLCSLKEGVDRPCLAVRMVFDAHGHKREHRFMRGMMRSAAKLSYPGSAGRHRRQRPNDKTRPLLDTVLKPLWAAYAVLRRRATSAGRSISTCPSARSSSTRWAAWPASSRRSGSTRTG